MEKKSLQLAEWVGCTRCELGVLRQAQHSKMCWGGGATEPGGIVVVYEHTSEWDARSGQPLHTEEGALLDQVFQRLGSPPHYRIPLVACRSCTPMYVDGVLAERVNTQTGRSETVYRDAPPTPDQIKACRPRLLEQLYQLDPGILILMGSLSVSAVSGKPLNIVDNQGREIEIAIPGRLPKPSLSAKRHLWRRAGQPNPYPLLRNMVRYTAVLTRSPQWVLANQADKGPLGALSLFFTHIRSAVETWHRYRHEVLGTSLLGNQDPYAAAEIEAILVGPAPPAPGSADDSEDDSEDD